MEKLLKVNYSTFDQFPSFNKCGSTDSVYNINIPLLKIYRNRIDNNFADRNISVWAVLVVKDDSYRVIEWIVWHYLLGVDYFVIHDHNSTDNLKQSLGILPSQMKFTITIC